MMRLILILASLLAITPASAGETTSEQRLAVGKTGIYCVTTPCPWRGITELGATSDARRLIWSGNDLPQLAARADDAARLRDAWERMACLEVQGTLDGTVLRVDRIIGACA
jgi:hypothetical protein